MVDTRTRATMPQAGKSQKKTEEEDLVLKDAKNAARDAAQRKHTELASKGTKPAVAKTAIFRDSREAAFNAVLKLNPKYAENNKHVIDKVAKTAAERECVMYDISDNSRKKGIIDATRLEHEDLLACVCRMEKNTSGDGFCAVTISDDDDDCTLLYVPTEMMPYLHNTSFDHNGAQVFFDNSSPIVKSLLGDEVDERKLEMELVKASNPFGRPMTVSEFSVLLGKVNTTDRFQLGEPVLIMIPNRKKHTGNVFSDNGDDYKEVACMIKSVRPFTVGECIQLGNTDNNHLIQSMEEADFDDDEWTRPYSLWCTPFTRTSSTLWYPHSSANGVHNILSAKYESDEPPAVGEVIEVGGKKYLVRDMVESYSFSGVAYQDIYVNLVE